MEEQSTATPRASWSWLVTDETPTLDAALLYAAAGLVPCALHRPLFKEGALVGCTCRKECGKSSGKHPVSRAWQKSSSDADAVRDAFTLTFEPNIGLVMGEQPNGDYLVALDDDDQERLAALVTEHGELPPTLECSSPRGSRRIYRVPPGADRSLLRNIAGVGGEPGVDLKASAGQVAVAPSLHQSGKRYAWTRVAEPAMLPPSWCLLILAKPVPPPELKQYTPAQLANDAKAQGRMRKWLQAAVVGICSVVAGSREGMRNNTFTHACWSAFSAANGSGLGEAWDYTARELASAGLSCGLEEAEVRSVIARTMQKIRDTGVMRTPQLVASPDLWQPKPTAAAPAQTVALILDGGRPAGLAENVARLLAGHPRWAGGVRTDLYSGVVVWPDGRMLRKVDFSIIQAWLFETVAIKVGVDVVEAGVRLAASRRTYDSPAEWLSALPPWDGTKRIDSWVPTYLGTTDSAYTRDGGRAWLRACVARALKPGLLVDIVPVMVGPQGVGKNRALNILFSKPESSPMAWTATLVKFDPDSPDLKRLAVSRWVLVDDEGHALNRKLVAKVKGWVSQQDEQYVAKYENDVTVAPRRALLVTSTNNERFLSDHTGNRRFLVWDVQRVDWDALERDREQLFAEVMHERGRGVDWRDGLDALIYGEEAADVAEANTEDDALEGMLRQLVRTGRWTGWAEAHELALMLGVTPERADRAWSTRLGMALSRLKYASRRRQRGDFKVRVYWPGKASDAPING